jgi:adenosylmethionine-8-amino-7-oxononanoate aminotransferase
MTSHVFFKETKRPTITHGEGIFLYDSAGRRYLDAIGGTHLNSIGYGVKAIGASWYQRRMG